jgi:transcriptional regulator GlxA family with amidase domain
VLTWRRPGDIAQVSTAITVQEKLRHDFRGLVDWMHAHLAEPLDVMALASQAGMSLRHFQRRFKACTGDAPARFLERIRLEHGRTLLSSAMPVKSIAAQCGYANAQQFAKAYCRRFGVTVRESRAGRRPDAASPGAGSGR